MSALVFFVIFLTYSTTTARKKIIFKETLTCLSIMKRDLVSGYGDPCHGHKKVRNFCFYQFLNQAWKEVSTHQISCFYPQMQTFTVNPCSPIPLFYFFFFLFNASKHRTLVHFVYIVLLLCTVQVHYIVVYLKPEREEPETV